MLPPAADRYHKDSGDRSRPPPSGAFKRERRTRAARPSTRDRRVSGVRVTFGPPQGGQQALNVLGVAFATSHDGGVNQAPIDPADLAGSLRPFGESTMLPAAAYTS